MVRGNGFDLIQSALMKVLRTEDGVDIPVEVRVDVLDLDSLLEGRVKLEHSLKDTELI